MMIYSPWQGGICRICENAKMYATLRCTASNVPLESALPCYMVDFCDSFRYIGDRNDNSHKEVER